MKRTSKKHTLHWLFWWLMQFITTLAAAMLVALCYPLGNILHSILLWGIYPLFGAFTACICTVKGLLNYAAWIAPPLMVIAGNSIIWGYPLTPGPVFLCAVISLIGAATGEVLKRQNKSN